MISPKFMTAVCLFLCLTLLISCGGIADKDSEHRYTNALIDETSPYLLQHAHNPVNWQPWSQEALDEAAEENKLVLVSIGYSSCHWCHVMEEETFEDVEVARLMNENFINIKVDREERPDVDQVYMTALQLLKGSGGWPLNVVTLPNGKPLYGGTYHTREQWMLVLEQISKLYRETPEKAEEFADKVAQGIQAVNLVEPSKPGQELKVEGLQQGLSLWASRWDTVYGGNQGHQKFMIPGNLEFLLDYGILTGEQQVHDFLETTLDKMMMGGVYDQLGGGFFRYSTDQYWKVPHFEKMLYDNAQLIGLYSKAFKYFKKDAYLQLIAETTSWLYREMRHADGAYFAAMDADSEGGEGAYYIWPGEELKESLGEDFALFSSYYGIQEGKAWEEGKFVLHREEGDEEFLGANNLSQSQLDSLKSNWKKLLLPLRYKRSAPALDDKVITSWNALLVKGFTEAFEATGDKGYLDRAIEVYDFLLKNNIKEGRLSHSFKENSRFIPGFLEDYAFMAEAALKLYGVTMEQRYLDHAREWMETVQKDFSDDNSGLYRYSQKQELISTIIKTDDGVIPSPNAVVAENLLILGHIDYSKDALAKSREMLGSLTDYLSQSPDSYARWGRLFLMTVYPYYEIAVVGDEAADLLREMNSRYIPNALVLGQDGESEMPLFKNRYVEGETYIYVCQNHSCRLPVKEVPEAIGQLSLQLPEHYSRSSL